jgi:hypothetical protein
MERPKMRLSFGGWLAVALAISVPASPSPLFAVEVSTVEGNGCPFAFEVLDADSFKRRPAHLFEAGYVISWNWPGAIAHGECSKNQDILWLAFNQGGCTIDPLEPSLEVCRSSRRSGGAEAFGTSVRGRRGRLDGEVQYEEVIVYWATDTSGWVLRLTAEGRPSFEVQGAVRSEEFTKTLDAMKAVVVSVRRTAQ